MKNRKLTIYCKNGTTLRFEQEKDIDTLFGYAVRFRYTSASRRDVVAHATFLFVNIAGFALDKE